MTLISVDWMLDRAVKRMNHARQCKAGGNLVKAVEHAISAFTLLNVIEDHGDLMSSEAVRHWKLKDEWSALWVELDGNVQLSKIGDAQ